MRVTCRIFADWEAVNGTVHAGTNPDCLLRRVLCTAGPSPRGRGSPMASGNEVRCIGSIPAWAGEPRRRLSDARLTGVHPRVGGGAPHNDQPEHQRQGPSPRGRGSHQNRRPGRGRLRSIPAWAGEPSRAPMSQCRARVHPRVGGGATPGSVTGLTLEGPSPRGRGSHGAPAGERDSAGSIPAWAGEPSGRA